MKETLHALNGNKTASDGKGSKSNAKKLCTHLEKARVALAVPTERLRRMGVNRTTLLSRMKKFGIEPGQYA